MLQDMQGRLEAVNHHAAAVGMGIKASKTKLMPPLIPDEQCQAALLDGEPLEDVDKFKYLGSMFVARTVRAPRRSEVGSTRSHDK